MRVVENCPSQRENPIDPSEFHLKISLDLSIRIPPSLRRAQESAEDLEYSPKTVPGSSEVPGESADAYIVLVESGYGEGYQACWIIEWEYVEESVTG